MSPISGRGYSAVPFFGTVLYIIGKERKVYHGESPVVF